MENEHTGDAQNKDSAQAAPTPATHEAQSDVTPHSSNGEKENWFEKLDKYTKMVTKDITFVHLLEVCAFCVGCIVAAIYYSQLQEMAAQTRLLGEQANRSVIENIGNAVTTKRQLDALQQQVNASQGSLETTQQQFRDDRRPMIRIAEYDLGDLLSQQKIAHPQLNETLFVNIPFTNIGKTPALNLIAHYHLMFATQGSQFKIELADSADRVGDMLEPGTNVGSFVTAISLKEIYGRESPDMDPKQQVIGWDGSDIYVFGRITYEDYYGTHYCLPYMQKLLSSGAWVSVSSLSVGQSTFLTTQLCPAHTRR